MHIEKFIGGLVEGKKVYRKDVLGGTGRVYGHSEQVHFEICCDADNLKKIIGRHPTWQDPQHPPAKDGRTDSVFGNFYVYLPAATPTSNTAPADHLRHDTGSTLGAAQWIKLDYGDGGTTPGACVLTSYSTTGQSGNARTDNDAEYNLYKDATDRHNIVIKAHPHAQSSPSGWYELLRFGRNLGRSDTGKDPLPDNAAHWRKIKTIAGNEIWADLNAPGSYKFSDADFLPQFGWNCYDDDIADKDQRCDSLKLKALIRTQDDQPDPDRNKDDVKLSRRLGDKDVARALRRTICKFPSEWDRGTISQRYGWLNEMEYGFKDRPDDWKRFENHLKAISFDKLPQEYLNAQWHFHPTEFIKLFRKCGWLSEKEFKQLLPLMVLRGKETSAAWEQVAPNNAKEKENSVFTAHRIPLNQAFRKYGITTPQRMAAFFGNSIQETAWWGKLHEGNSTQWYSPWDGRGFLQLTHPANYIQYWKFRGRHIDAQGEKSLLSAYKKADEARKSKDEGISKSANQYLADGVSGVTLQMKEWRNLVGQNGPEMKDATDAADSAGVYWAWMDMARYADEQIKIERRTAATPHGVKVYYRSEAFWRAAAKVNLPKKLNDSYSTSLNGFVDRCVPWAQALAVLTEMTFPPNSGVVKLDYPEGHVPRREK